MNWEIWLVSLCCMLGFLTIDLCVTAFYREKRWEKDIYKQKEYWEKQYNLEMDRDFEYKNRVKKLVDEKIEYCEDGILKVIEGEKNSYIVKHDIAIKLFKELKKELDL